MSRASAQKMQGAGSPTARRRARRPSRFAQRDVTRALKAAAQAGVRARVDVLPDGRISIVPIDAEPQEATESEFDRWRASRAGTS
jgi:hypothetical protein